MLPPRLRLPAAAAGTLAVLLATAASVSAHAVRQVGAYTIAIGWKTEPTYVGQVNAVQLFVWSGPSSGDYQANPVSDLNQNPSSPDLQVTVSYGSATSSPLFLTPSYDPDTGLGNPAEYDAPVTPTQVGNYTFHLTGSIRGTPVDISVTSGPQTFNTVETTTSIDFPNAEPDLGSVATKLDQVSSRVTTTVTAADRASTDAAGASSAATVALILGIVALVAALGLGGASLGMTLRRRRS